MKKILLSLCVVFATMSYAQQWTQLIEAGGASRYGAMEFVIDDQAYIVGGLNTVNSSFEAYNDLWKYNDTSDTWSQMASFPGSNIYDGVAFVIDSLAYVGLGADQFGNRYRHIWAYNPRSDSWNQVASLPTSAARTGAFSFVLNGKAIIGAGDTYINGNRVYFKDVWEYNPLTDTWIQKGDFTGGGRVGMSAQVVNGRAFVGLGDDGFIFYTSYFEYDPINDDWLPKANFPGPNRSFYSTTVAQDRIYLMSGEDLSSFFTNEMWSYNPIADAWQAKWHFAGPKRAFANMFYLHGSFYFGLGLSEASSLGLADFWKLEVSGIGLEEETKTYFSVYPNPSTGLINLNFPNHKLTTAELRDLNGKMLLKFNHEKLVKGQLNLGQLEPGIYILHLFVEGRTISLKINIQ